MFHRNIISLTNKTCIFYFRVFFILLLIFGSATVSNASSVTVIRGFVRDSLSGKVLSLANIHFENQPIYQKTNFNGFFEITDSTGTNIIIISFNNYKEKKVIVKVGQLNALDILLLPENYSIGVFDKILPTDTFALSLMQKVIQNKNKNRPEIQSVYQFDKYEKLTISVDDILNALKTNKVTKKFEDAYNDLEVSDFTGEPILTISMKEFLSSEFRKNQPEESKTIIYAERHEGLDNTSLAKAFITLLEETFKDIDIFQDKIIYLYREMISPFSTSNAFDHYTYMLEDTVIFKEIPCVKVKFIPSKSKDFGLMGDVWVSLDGNYKVQKITLYFPPNNSVNFVKQLLINQEFEQSQDSLYVKSYESTTVEFDGFKVIYNLYAKRESVFSNYRAENINNTAFQFSEDVTILKNSEDYTDKYWLEKRPIPLKIKTEEEKELEDEFQRSPLFKTSIALLKILTSGYVQTNGSKDKNKVDIGPIGTFFSVNEVEGVRLKLGGATTSNLSKYFYLKGYGAYGIKDERFKYSGTGTWSINGKHPEYDYGIHTLSFQYQYDVDIPGEHFFYSNPDNIFLSFKRKGDDKMTYLRKALLTYKKENDNGLSVELWTHAQNETATGSLQFLQVDPSGNVIDLKDYNASEIGLRLRYAHNNFFYQRRNARVPVNRKVPVFYFSYDQGIKGYLGGEYNYQFAEFSVNKIFWMSTVGHADVWFKSGRIWGDLPFPLLILPNANQTYTIQPEAYDMLNPIEFINDKYVSLDMLFHFNGFLLKKIPFIDRLKWREVLSFKALYGDLSDNNLPENNPDLFLFPEGSRTMGKDPYMEASIGIENIFKVLRISYVRRLTYLNDPDISKGGVRFSVRFSF